MVFWVFEGDGHPSDQMSHLLLRLIFSLPMENKSTSSDALSALALHASDNVQVVVSEPVADASNVDHKLSLQQVACPSQYFHRPTVSLGEPNGVEPHTRAKLPDPGSPSPIVTVLGPFDAPVGSEDSTRAVPLERVRRRLTSAFFIYFLCGWGDGGLISYYIRVFSR